MNATTDKLFVDWKKGLKPKTASTYEDSILKFFELHLRRSGPIKS